jgi:GPH family glycoside/pentoside/hexuronide:cation symporter
MASPEFAPASDPASAPDEATSATFAEVGEKLPISIKLAYGMPNFAGVAMVIPLGIHMNIFYSDTLLVPLGYIGLAIALARGLDALTDPLMGWLTDRTKTRWGRRIPWMFVGAPLCAVAFFFLFSPPRGIHGIDAVPWLVSFYMIYYVTHTMYVIPHYGLGVELTQDYRERSSVFAWQEGFTLLGTLCGATLPYVALSLAGDPYSGYSAFAGIFGGLLALLYFWQCYKIKERPEFYQQKPNPIVPGLRRVMRNRPAMILLASYFMGAVAGAIPGLMTPYFVKYVLMPENPDQIIAVYLATYFAAAVVTMPLWLLASRRFGKKPLLIISRMMGISASLMLFTMGEGDVLPSLLVLLWGGCALAPGIFLNQSIQGDVIDYDQLYSGRRREAQYGSAWSFVTKFTAVPSAAVPLAVLGSLGYVANQPQDESVVFAIRAIYGLAPASMGVLSLLAFMLFPIDEKAHGQVLEGIERHKRGESAVDPLTGKPVPPPNQRGIDEETGWFLDHFSPRELLRGVESGLASISNRAVLKTVACLGGAAAMAMMVQPVLADLSVKPGIWTSLQVVAGGVCLGFVGFHAVRVRAARQLVANPIAATVIRRHLEITRTIRS